MSRDARARIEWPVVLPAGGLLLISMLFVWSAMAGQGGALWARQLAFILAGIAGIWLIRRLGTDRLAMLAFPLYLGLLAVLAVLPLVGDSGGTGAMRWIPTPLGVKVQPSEFMKLGLVLVLARHLQYRGVTNTWRSYLTPFALTLVPWFLVMRQPDLGSSLVLLPVFVAMVTVSGARLAHVLLVVVLVLAILPAAYFIPGVLERYQKDRIDAFLTPIPAIVLEAQQLRQARQHLPARALEQRITELKRGTGRQQFYAVVAIGSGGLAGAGLTAGIQNQGNVLPVQQTDFIFAILGEEWGLAGTTLVLVLYACLVAAILGVAHRTREPFGRLVCVGVGALIGGQALMHLGINTGLLPVTGLPLPLVSYGGSSILAMLLGLGCVLDVAGRQKVVFFEQ